MGYLDSLDIANRSCDHLEQTHIEAVDEDSRKNTLLANAYDKLRPAELRRNIWSFSKRKVMLRAITATTMLLAPQAWAVGVTYPVGAVVADANGDLWASTLTENLGQEPGVSAAWDQYFGPMTVDVYDTTVSYAAGELVYVAGTNPGSFVIYRSLENDNDEAPQTAEAWAAATTYGLGDVVSYSGSQWRSRIALNLAVTPADGPSAYNSLVTYAAAQTVMGSDGYIYSSIAGSNLGNDPVLDAAVHWTNTTVPVGWDRTPTIWPSSTSWVPLFANMTNITFVYPISTGPTVSTSTANVFRKPAGWLRKATLDPKGSKEYDLTEIMGNYIIGADSPLLLEFVADIKYVPDMDPMFCEGLASRMALETCKAITQSLTKYQSIGQAYHTFMTEARMVNAIEDGFEEAPEDYWITVRI